MYSRYRAYYFEELPIARLQTIDFEHMHFGNQHTGGMPLEEFLSLKDSIRKDGLINPIVVEVDAGNPRRFRIAMGNNRVEACDQLGDTTIKSLVIVKGHDHPFDGLGDYVEIEQTNLEDFMTQAHPGDTLWKKSAWVDRILRATA